MALGLNQLIGGPLAQQQQIRPQRGQFLGGRGGPFLRAGTSLPPQQPILNPGAQQPQRPPQGLPPTAPSLISAGAPSLPTSVSSLPSLAPIVGGAAVGGLQAQGLSDLAQGKSPSALGHAALLPITGGFSLLADPISSAFGSGKSGDQKKRDVLRDHLESLNFAFRGPDGSHRVTLADGNEFDIGIEGRRLVNAAGRARDGFEVDFEDPNASSLVGLIDPLSSIIAAGDEAVRSSLSGYLTNAAFSSGDPIANAKKFYSDIFKTSDPRELRELARGEVEKLFSEGRIDEGERDSFAASIDRMFLTEDPLNAPGARGGDVGAAKLVAEIQSKQGQPK